MKARESHPNQRLSEGKEIHQMQEGIDGAEDFDMEERNIIVIIIVVRQIKLIKSSDIFPKLIKNLSFYFTHILDSNSPCLLAIAFCEERQICGRLMRNICNTFQDFGMNIPLHSCLNMRRNDTIAEQMALCDRNIN